MPVCSIVKLLPLDTMGDLMHHCTRLNASCNSQSGRPQHLEVLVLTMRQTGMNTLVNVYVDLVVFTPIAGTL